MDGEWNVIDCLWNTQILCIGIVLEGKVKNIATFQDMEEALQELNDSTANRRWEELKARVQLSDEFITRVKTYTERCIFEYCTHVAEEDSTTILKVCKTLLALTKP